MFGYAYVDTYSDNKSRFSHPTPPNEPYSSIYLKHPMILFVGYSYSNWIKPGVCEFKYIYGLNPINCL